MRPASGKGATPPFHPACAPACVRQGVASASGRPWALELPTEWTRGRGRARLGDGLGGHPRFGCLAASAHPAPCPARACLWERRLASLP